MPTEKTNIVRGIVRDKENRPLIGLIVEVYDKDMRNETLLGESLTDKEGKYEVSYSDKQLSDRERKSADILFRVYTRKKKTLLYESTLDEVHFNASNDERIDITLSKPVPQEEVEYDVLLERVTLLAHNIPLSQLQEDEKHQDISFLSKEAEFPADTIAHLVIAHRVQELTDIDAAFFYALLRQDTLLKRDLKKPFLSRLHIGLESETLPLVYEAALIEPKTLETSVKKAVKKMIVSKETIGHTKQSLSILESYKKKALVYYEQEHPKKVLEDIGHFLNPDRLKTLLSTENLDLPTLLATFNDKTLFDSTRAANDAKTTLEMGVLLGFDEVIVERVKEIEKITKPEEIKKLAMLNKAGWEKVLKKSAKKIHLAGKPIDAKMITFHASSLANKLEKEYPSVAFLAQLERNKGADTVLTNPKELIVFMKKHDSFDLENTNIVDFMKKKKLSLEKNQSLINELKTVQRVFKLIPHYTKANALLKENIHSAQSIVSLGKSRFMNEVAPKVKLTDLEAKEMYIKAENVHFATVHTLGELLDISSARDIAALANEGSTKKLEAVSKDFPNLKSLFSLGDSCECQHCRSVYSPAAYMVETLQFLDKRLVKDVDGAISDAKKILFERRPDLGELDLSCANANTPVPYIDLVCELLENTVSPNKGISFSGNITTGKISTILLNALKDEMPVTKDAMIYASETPSGVSLPYYLRDEKVVCKIEEKSTGKYTIFRLKQTLSSAQELDAKPEYVNAKAYNKLKTSSYAFTLPFDLNHVEAQAYFERFGTERADLMEAFQVDNKPKTKEIAAEKLELTSKEQKLIVTADINNQKDYWNVTLGEMKKVNTFLDKTSLSYKDLEELLSLTFIDPDTTLFIKHLDETCDTDKKTIAKLDNAALDRIHRFLRLQKKTGLDFALLNAIIIQSTLGKGTLDDACLITLTQLQNISKKTGLSLNSLVALYESNDKVPLMQALSLNKETFEIFKTFSSIGNVYKNAKDTLTFVDTVLEFDKSPLDAVDVNFMLRHEGTTSIPLEILEISDERTETILTTLQTAYAAAKSKNETLYVDPLTVEEQKETLSTAFSSLVTEEETKTLLSFLDKKWETIQKAKDFVDTTLGTISDIDTSIIKVEIKTNLDNKKLLESFFTFISEHHIAQAKSSILTEALETAFKTEQTLIQTILTHAQLKQGNALKIKEILLSIADGAFTDEQTGSIKLLHKLFSLLDSFALSPAEVVWYFTHSNELGFFEWDAIPYQSGQIAIDYRQYIDFCEMLMFSKTYAPIINPTDAENPVNFYTLLEMSLLIPVNKNAFITYFSLLTGYKKNVLENLHNYFGLSIADYQKAHTWSMLITTAEMLRQLNATVDEVKTYIKSVLTESETASLQHNLKVRYDSNTWLQTLKEIMDVIRPQKRNALVTYLLAENPEIKSKNDLYDYFLVDVEMEACMPSSRIVQAHGSIQLFVQRCLMGLEPKAIVSIHEDKSWAQWKWMKNYRVWEANRKVFLYPENWIEAELRDDKSFLFTELQNELQQNELTNYTAEQALTKYLEKLDDIAFLEVMATWYQSDIKTMHVFARTKGGDPAIYYYRRFEQERYWTPWEKVELDITGDHLLAYVRNDRLHLAWPMFSEEADPNQKAKLPDQTREDEQDIPKPKKKLKIQLAISEFSNNTWQPKKISKDAMYAPKNSFIIDMPNKENFNLLYIEHKQQIAITYTGGCWVNKKLYSCADTYNLTGCKGYPELANENTWYDPNVFCNTTLKSQRYTSNPKTNRMGKYLIGDNCFPVLSKTSDIYRITYPHQITALDRLFFSKKGLNKFGNFLPYFMEDSHHAYVIIPGLYASKNNNSDTKTVSNILKLFETAMRLYDKYKKKYIDKLNENLTDTEKEKLIEAMKNEISSDSDVKDLIEEFKSYANLRIGEQFKNMYHPLICPLRTILYKNGISSLMQRDTQMQKSDFNFNTYYEPTAIVPKTYTLPNSTLSYPVEDLDFTSDGSYSSYNWELFFHVPMLIATQLTKNQRFEEAMEWFHYMFDPTGALEGETPQKYWVTKPFFLTQKKDYEAQRIDTLLYDAPNENKELEFAINQWRNKPFQPHAIARFRPVAYQKALLMKYIDNLIEWGDYLFRQDTMESMTQATQMYIMADKLLGKKPRVVPPIVNNPYETYNQIEKKLDLFGNALIELENSVPNLSALPEGGKELPVDANNTLDFSSLYFCIPHNEQMLAYWDRIADRLFKIRHCQNIDGVERSLALFAPPIDPGMLVRAAAGGLDMASVLAGVNAPMPYYRFNVLAQKATELAQEVRGLGASLLQSLEKKDAEEMGLLRSELEQKVLTAITDMKELQISEATEQIEILKKTKAVTEERYTYYRNIEKIISKEKLSLEKLGESHDYQIAAQGVKLAASIILLLPDIDLGASGFGGSPVAKAKIGGLNLGQATSAASDILSFLGALASNESTRANIRAGHERRYDNWKLQERLAEKELDSIEQQLLAADIRKEIAQTDLKNHELQIENSEKTDDFMRSKYTNKELYTWMLGQISSVYFKSYQLAYDFAKKAERSYRFELGNNDSFIQVGYWDNMKKGLQSADKLIHDIKRMEVAYMESNKREYELTKHISLSMLDPLALVKLRDTGVCDFNIPEALYDMDHAGQYFRRIKSVSISMPCITGSYTSVSTKLSLISNKYRKNTDTSNGYMEVDDDSRFKYNNRKNTDTSNGYMEVDDDSRFKYNIGAIQSIATSSAQNDSGVFELNFRDERYLPFEGTGAISSWRLELPKKVRQFNYNTISDVILHVKYTAREGGSILKEKSEETLKNTLTSIQQELSESGLHIAVNMKHDMSTAWHQLKTNGKIDISIDKSRLPYFVQSLNASIEKVLFIAKLEDNPQNYTLNIKSNQISLAKNDELTLNKGETDTLSLDETFEVSGDVSQLEELLMVVKYTFS